MSNLLEALLVGELKTFPEEPSPASPSSAIRGDAGDAGDDVSEKVLEAKPATTHACAEDPALTRTIIPAARRLLIPSEVRAKIEAVERFRTLAGQPRNRSSPYAGATA